MILCRCVSADIVADMQEALVRVRNRLSRDLVDVDPELLMQVMPPAIPFVR